MPEIKRYRHGVPNWVDVSTRDIPTTVEFYSMLFGWEAADQGAEAGHYHMLRKGGLDVAGLGPAQPGQPTAWSTYIAVDDADDALAKATAAGGTAMMPVTDVFEQGRMAFVSDPTGAMVGLWQGKATIGSRIVNEPASPVWHELGTRDLDAAKDFYTALAGWDYAPMDGPNTYLLCQVNGRPVCGMMPLSDEMPAETPSHWMAYFGVSDTDTSARRVTELGGAIIVEPFDTPVGRAAVVRDSTGATFSIISLGELIDPNAGWND
jgi:predicted enzyme related to lactoylglutathione lyase